jgi:cytochrome d ubiquinol oxidase subunit I
MEFDPVLLSRIQFAFTISFHILFPAITIGLASWLAVIEWRYLKTGDDLYRQIYQFWVKIFAVTFGMGVVSGVVMSYQFGTNWSAFSDKVGNVIGPLMGFEALTAFFLEASFLGIMLFGWGRVGKRLHFTSTVLVAFGTLLSAFWILSANSWMHTPTGHRIEDGIFYPESWLAIIFNPSLPYRFVHMVLAAYLTTACVVTGIAAWYLWRGRFVRHARVMLSYGLWFIAIAAPAQLIAGDLHGLNTLEHQPAKVAAMEGNWETQKGAPLLLFAVPDQADATNHYEIGIPGGASYLLKHDWQGEVPGLKEWPREERPNVAWVFYCFRIMVGIGVFMIAAGLISLYLRWRGRLYDTRWFQYMCMALTPMGFVAVLAGWFVTEIGRQPWLVYGLLDRSEGISPVPGESVAISLAVFVIVYTIVFGAGTYYILKLIGKGPETHDTDTHDDPAAGVHPLRYPAARTSI